MDRADFAGWIERYEEAWRSPGTGALAGLFTESATYRTAPFEVPFEGFGAIAELWEAERTGPEEAFEMSFELVAVEGEVGVARVDVRYGPPKEQRYLDLWVIRLDADGLCTEFEEWPFWPPGTSGSHIQNRAD
jgi:hypothetical protein